MFENLNLSEYYLYLSVLCGVGYVIASLLLSTYARFKLFDPAKNLEPEPIPSQKEIMLSKGVSVCYQFLGDPESQFVILYSHGNRTQLAFLQPFINDWVARGFAVFAYDYPGYGSSRGAPTESRLNQSVLAAYHTLIHTYHFKPGQIIAMGRSLGSGPTLYLAEKALVGAVILHSAFKSIYSIRTRANPFLFDLFPNHKRIKTLNVPLLVIHGKQDRLTPFSHALELYQACPSAKECLFVENGHHNDLLDLLGEEYFERVQTFIKRELTEKAP